MWNTSLTLKWMNQINDGQCIQTLYSILATNLKQTENYFSFIYIPVVLSQTPKIILQLPDNTSCTKVWTVSTTILYFINAEQSYFLLHSWFILVFSENFCNTSSYSTQNTSVTLDRSLYTYTEEVLISYSYYKVWDICTCGCVHIGQGTTHSMLSNAVNKTLGLAQAHPNKAR